jgi:hypothetical protein
MMLSVLLQGLHFSWCFLPVLDPDVSMMLA